MFERSPNIMEEENFPPEVCPACGYSLQGLPSEGVCPECGNAYDSSQLILHGWACGQHANVSNARGWRLLLAMALPLLYSWQLFLPRTGNVLRIGVFSFWGLIIALAFFRRRSTDHPGGIQLRMNRHGIRQLDQLARLREDSEVSPILFDSWSVLGVSKWEPVEPDKLRVRLQKKKLWWGLSNYPVDAEVFCTSEKAQEIRALIGRWQQHER